MLNVFPGLLLPFLAPTILRVVIGLVFIGLGIRTWRHAQRLANVEVPVVGSRAWVPYLAAFFEITLGLMFIAGWYTQVAALIGALGTIKYAVYYKWWPHMLEKFYPISPLAAGLMGAICFSLLISGAGAFARDLPL
mgnify:CR=1 FL=1